jgi:hypothetical protein
MKTILSLLLMNFLINNTKNMICIPNPALLFYPQAKPVLVCKQGLIKLYDEQNNTRVIRGGPFLVEQGIGMTDPATAFHNYRGGHFVVEEVTDTSITIVTNRHTAVKDDVWQLILFILCALSFILCTYFLGSKWLGYIVSLAYFIYILPLLQLSPTPFRQVSELFNDCVIIQEQRMGLEFVPYPFKHFVYLNDWIRLRCPRDLEVPFVYDDLGQYNRGLNTTTPDTLGILHRSSSGFWERAHFESWFSYVDPDLGAYINTKRDVCNNRLCWWGNEGNVVVDNENYYVVNSTILELHIGLSCRRSPSDKGYFGIVQEYHAGYGLPICSKVVVSEKWYASLEIYTFAPFILLLVYFATKDFSKRLYLLGSMGIIFVIFLRILK